MPLEEKTNFEFEEKKFRLLLKVAFSSQKRPQNSLFSNKQLFFLEFKIRFFFVRQLRMTILDCCISLKMIKKIFGCVGSCGYAPTSVKYRLNPWCLYISIQSFSGYCKLKVSNRNNNVSCCRGLFSNSKWNELNLSNSSKVWSLTTKQQQNRLRFCV